MARALSRFGMSLRIAFAAGALALGLAVVLGGFARAPVLVVDVAAARERLLTVLVATNGVVEPIAEAEIRARLGGRVVAIPEAGARIRAGELLLKIDEGPTAAELSRTKSQRLAALDSLREAKDKLARTLRRVDHDRGLFRNQALTQERLDESLADLREAEAAVTFLRSEVPLRVASLDLRIAELRAQRDGAELRAAFDGIVYKTDAKRGQQVRAGDAIVWFADLERLRIRANIDQVDLGRVRVGQALRITSNAYPGRSWPAQIVELIPNVVKKQSRFVAEALATVEPPAAGLMPGMMVDLEIAIEAVPDALQVPSEAILSDERGAFVYRLEEGRLRQTRVELGRSTALNSEVVAGLADGDLVVIGSPVGLRDGEPAEPRFVQLADSPNPPNAPGQPVPPALPAVAGHSAGGVAGRVAD